MGAGSVGGFVGGLLASQADTAVTFVGRSGFVERVCADGLVWRDQSRAPESVSVHEAGKEREGAHVTATTELSSLAGCDVVLVCVKSGDTPSVGVALAGVLGPETTVVSLQNGLANAPALRAALGDEADVVAGIVSFNVVTATGDETVYHRTMDGPLMLGPGRRDDRVAALVERLGAGGVGARQYEDLVAHQWTKLVVNLNNAISALSGQPTVAMLASPRYRYVIASLIDEALDVLRGAGIKPARLRGVPLSWMPKILRLPTWLVKRIIGAQMKIDPEARSSMWEDLQRRRGTEVRYLNGEVVALAESTGQDAPLNRRVVASIERASEAAAGSPGLSAEALAQALGLGSV